MTLVGGWVPGVGLDMVVIDVDIGEDWVSLLLCTERRRKAMNTRR